MIHEVVDIARWKAEFPLATLRDEARRNVLAQRAQTPDRYPTPQSIVRHIAAMQPGGQSVTSPYHLAVVEQLRVEAQVGSTITGAVTADVFIFGRGEPARRESTKVGGLPYWPARRPWPTSSASTPLTFIAQFCFADSLDIVGRVPGDVLLIFAAGQPVNGKEPDGNEQPVNGEEAEPELHFEWLRLGETSLIAADAIPPTGWSVTPFYGAIHRTVDYPGAAAVFSQYHQPERIALLDGTKIGGVPRWMQLGDGWPGWFLCSLGPIRAARERPYPYVNDAQPIQASDPCEASPARWAPRRPLALFLDERGQIARS